VKVDGVQGKADPDNVSNFVAAAGGRVADIEMVRHYIEAE